MMQQQLILQLMNLSNEMMKIYEVIQKAEAEKNAAGNATSEAEPKAEESKEEGTGEGK
jgi:hypothetical protein